MKKIISFIKQRIDWILIAIGSFMAIYGIFGFEPTARIHSPGYHYEQDVRVIIALGITSLVLGILLYKEKRR